MRTPRQFTNELLRLVDDGILDKDAVIMACVKYMSEDDVKYMMLLNEFILDEEGDDDE